MKGGMILISLVSMVLISAFAYSKITPQKKNIQLPLLKNNTVAVIPTPQAVQTPAPILDSLPTRTSAPVSVLHEYLYPDATVINESNSSLHLESSDNPNMISSWYQSVLNHHSFSNRNTTATNNNQSVDDLFTASNNEESLSIHLLKAANSTMTTIEVKKQ